MKRKITITVLIAILCICSSSFLARAEEDTSMLFAKGYELMQEEDYRGAAEIYKTLYDKYEKAEIAIRNENVNTYNNLAICYEKLGHLYLSNEVFEKALLMAPPDKDYAFYCYKLSSSYNKMGNNHMAIYHAAEGLRASDNTYAYELYIEYGDALFAMKRYDNAEQFYRKAGEFAPDRLASVEEKLASIAIEKKDYSTAIENYKNIIEIDEGYKEYAYKKIVGLSAKNNKETLETEIKKYLIEELDYSDQRVANFLNDNGYYYEAIVYFDKALEDDENSIEIVYWKANALQQIGEYQKAIELFEKAYEINPDYKKSISKIIECYNSLGEFEKSNQYCDQILEQSPLDSFAIAYKNYNYIAMSDFENAARVIDSITGEENMPYNIYNAYLENLSVVTEEDIIRVYSQMDEFPEDEYQQALYIMNHIGLDHLSTESLQNYENYIKRFLETNRSDTYILSEYGRVLELNGKYDEANLAYTKACSFEGYRTEEIIELHINNVRNMYKYDKALQIAKEARESFPLNDNFKAWEASILYTDFNRPEEAILIYDEILKESPKNTYYMQGLMRCYDALENYENVLRLADQILEVFHDNIYAKAYKAKALQALDQDGADAIITDIENRQYSSCDADIICVYSILGRDEAVYEHLQAYFKEHPAKSKIERFSLDYDMKQSLYNEKIATLLNVQPLKETFLPEQLQNPMITILIIVVGFIFMFSGVILIIIRKKRKDKKC